ncbi:MAG TPA: YciI family protein [Steroidobacteraceae bacterium]|nr:YciI family protein [Steroidobacteraceae bacterium]
MRYFFFKLNPPRPNFASERTPEELVLMQEHVEYWSGLLAKGIAVAFGPVREPTCVYGVCIVRLDDGMDPHLLAADDPTIKANIGFRFDIYPMPNAKHIPMDR